MEWIKSQLEFTYAKKLTVRFPLVHFDSLEAPIVPGVQFDDPEWISRLEKAEDELGSVLWLDAIELFLPFLCNELSVRPANRAMCLGEGTGAVGCALAHTEGLIKEEIVISDLPNLYPLMALNASLARKKNKVPVTPLALDWNEPETTHPFDLIVGCEILYGNRFVWPALMETILACAEKKCTVYICVTLRNKRHDLEDFRDEFLRKHMRTIREVELSDNVVVLVANR
jgi:hypothetical protein